MGTDYGGHAAYGAEAWQGSQPGSVPSRGSAGQHGLGGQPRLAAPPGSGGSRRQGRGRAVAIAVLILGVAGLGVSLAGAATRVLPRQFTARQQRQILDWEAGKAWRVKSAGEIFPGTVSYQPPSELSGSPLLTATMIGIASQATCRAATDPAVAAVLDRNGCQAVLRATYADATDSYVVTVGVAAFPGAAAASAAHRELAGVAGTGGGTGGGARRKAASVAAGVRPVAFSGTPAAWFTSGRRQISASIARQTYIVFYTIGYADDRPREPVASDSYAYSEMTSLGAGVAHQVLATLAKPLQQPHCPGTPGC